MIWYSSNKPTGGGEGHSHYKSDGDAPTDTSNQRATVSVPIFLQKRGVIGCEIAQIMIILTFLLLNFRCDLQFFSKFDNPQENFDRKS